MGFKNSEVKWSEVTPAGTSRMLPAGGYVARITDVDDVESKEYLRFTYEIAEGEHAGFFQDDNRVYVHQFTRSYKEKARGFMSRFLRDVEESNKAFDLAKWDNDPENLKGLVIGIIVQREDYTNGQGSDRARMDVVGFASADEIRKGDYRLPDPKDNRVKPAEPEQATVYGNADIPF